MNALEGTQVPVDPPDGPSLQSSSFVLFSRKINRLSPLPLPCKSSWPSLHPLDLVDDLSLVWRGRCARTRVSEGWRGPGLSCESDLGLGVCDPKRVLSLVNRDPRPQPRLQLRLVTRRRQFPSFEILAEVFRGGKREIWLSEAITGGQRVRVVGKDGFPRRSLCWRGRRGATTIHVRVDASVRNVLAADRA